MVSPHTRGWTLKTALFNPLDAGFPAHAGMDPGCRFGGARRYGFPRTRGDGPCPARPRGRRDAVSPHTRGWTPHRAMAGVRPHGFPAHAGMDPIVPKSPCCRCRFPRTRGDGPVPDLVDLDIEMVSPHTRGWTRSGRPSPTWRPGFPAHAGMDPGRRPIAPGAVRFPRTRGDGPSTRLSSRAPTTVSPHTRGWTFWAARKGQSSPGFPAHAGMDRVAASGRGGARRFPRTRGDGPTTPRPVLPPRRVSPHTRGWTRPSSDGPYSGGGFPAHAGMDPAR